MYNLRKRNETKLPENQAEGSDAESEVSSNSSNSPQRRPPPQKKQKIKEPLNLFAPLPDCPSPVANPQVLQTQDMEKDGYAFVRTGNRFISRNAKKMSLDQGYTIHECRQWTRPYSRSGRNYPPQLMGLLVPTHISHQVSAMEKATKAKRNAALDRAGSLLRKKAMAMFNEIYPSMPHQADRDAIFDRAFQVGSGRIGRKPEFALADQIRMATRAHVKYQYTDFEDDWERGKEDLYHEYVAGCQEGDDRSYALEEFRQEKEELMQDLEGEKSADIDAILERWAARDGRDGAVE